MKILIDGKIAEYQKGINDFFWLVGNSSGLPINIGKEEALECAMDYHETEGCALYLELYPAPEKGDYAFIAQDAAGDWYGFESKPNAYKYRWDSTDYIYPKFIQSSPPNPFWRKTLR